MESISDIARARKPIEPTQIAALKKYAQDTHNIQISVKQSKHMYLIYVPSAAFAQKFRHETQDITRQCELDKPLVIHIG